jgi:aspartate 1-decarboxylase
MMRFLLRSKIHRATVTEARRDYVGSITIDLDLMEAADISVHEKVLVVDVDNGVRLETYAIPGPRRSGVMCMNGAAARLVHEGDRVIVMTFVGVDEKEVKTHQPRIVFVDDRNRAISTGTEDLELEDLPGGVL